MKRIIKNLMALSILAFACVSCSDAFKLDYEPSVSIVFNGAEKNMVTVGKGVLTYTASVTVNSNTGISAISVYKMDPKSGKKGNLIPGTDVTFDPAVSNYSFEQIIDSLSQNKAIKVVVEDKDGNEYQSNLVVKMTPSVLFADSKIIETADDYYGSYFASWLDGRVYLRSNGLSYASEVDFTMGQIPDGNGNFIPSLVSPAKRASLGLPSMPGLQATLFELTTLTSTEFNAITQVDATPITNLPDPTLDQVALTAGKVYLFKTANNKKGLIYVASSTGRTGTIEDANGVWKANTAYSRLTISTRTVQP